MTPVLVKISIIATKHHEQEAWRCKRIYLVYTLHCCEPLREIRTGTQQDRILEAVGDAEAMEGGSLLACFPLLVQHTCL